MSLIHTIIDVFTKIVVAAVLVLTTTTPPVAMPPTTTLSPWELPGEEQVATTTLPEPAPIISVAKKPAPATAETKPAPQTTPSAPVVGATPTPTTVSSPTPQTLPIQNTADLNTKARESLVNVLCTTSIGGYLKPISGSGVIIDPRGVVLTNAHIGQFLLLRDYPFPGNIECVLRAGSPASPMYTAQLLYFPKSWLDANASKITNQNPTGTGEHDYSLLLITGRTNPAATLPASFPYLKPYVGDDIRTGMSVLLAGYPAGFLEGVTITSSLHTASAIGTIKEIFTFIEGGGADLLSAPGTILSQKGSSGGAMVRTDTGELLGLVATATVADTTAERDLRAITLRHVNQSMIAQTDKSLSSYLQGDLRAKADAFNATVAPAFSKMLTDELSK